MRGAWIYPCLLLGLVTVTGCRPAEPPRFALNTEGRDRLTISGPQEQAVRAALADLFGSADDPTVPEGAGLQTGLLRAAAGPIGGDAEGRQWGLFRRYCAACHGISGDGAGPSAAVLNPYPRDFRNGLFKYTSTAGGGKPLRNDLRRTLRAGIPGTAMPSFARLVDGEREALVEYIKYLSIRGQTELYLFQTVVDEDAPLPLNLGEVLTEGVLPAAESWNRAQRLAVVPPEMPPVDTLERRAAAIGRGDKLFHSAAAQCRKCHGARGDGKGEQSKLYDDWNKRKKGGTPEQTQALSGQFALPLQSLRARNLRLGAFRGGDQPIDQYWRIAVGIKGTPMPAAGAAPGSKGALSPDEIWDVVQYVRSLAQ